MEEGSVTSEKVFELVYDELRKIAYHRLSLESANHTLQPTELVHEAWIRMGKDGDPLWTSQSSFFPMAALAMRRILVEHARKKSSYKRGGNPVREELFDFSAPLPDEKVLMVDAALQQLERVHSQRAKVVELKFFVGLTNRETAEVMEIGERTVARHWLLAKSWLFEWMQRS